MLVLGSTCLCRPLYKVPADANGSGQPTPTPSVASASSPAPSKIQKNGRRQSNLQTAPENIARALESIPALENHQVGDGASNHLPSYPHHHHIPASSNSHTPFSSVNPPTNLMFQNPVNGNENSRGNITSQSSSCCSTKPQPRMQIQGQGSCCRKPNSPPGSGFNIYTGSEEKRNLYSETDGASYSSLSPAHQIPWQDFDAIRQSHFIQPFSTHQPQTQTTSYLPRYNSGIQPTTPMSFQYQNSSNGLGFAHASMQPLLSSNPQSLAYAPPPTPNTDKPHDCNCGDNCQCLGCATHPFNETTRQHVQEMGALVSVDGDEPNWEARNGYHNPPFPGLSGASLMDYSFAGICNDVQNDIQQNRLQQYPERTTDPDLSNGYSSPAGYTPGPPLMTPSEYYTLEYSVGLPNSCSDLTGTCQCGSDCSCVGCLTHSGHSGVPLEPVATEETVPATSQAPGTAVEQPAVSWPQIPVLDDLPAPSSSPQVIER